MIIMHAAETIKGGVATYLNNTALWQADCEQVSMVVLVVPQSHFGELVPMLVNHAKVVVSTFPGAGRAQRIGALYTALRNCVQHIPVSIAHLHSTFAGLVGRLPGVLGSQTSIIYQPHGVCYDPHRARGLSGLAMRWIEHRFSRSTEAIVAISDYESRVLRDAGMGERVRVIKNTVVEAGRCDIDCRELRDYYLFVGRMDKQKGFDMLTDFWQKSDRKLLVVGERVLAQGNSRTDLPNMRFTGWVANDDIDRYYAGAKALIVPSRWEGFGLVVLEAYRNGTPVICSDRGALPELVVEGVTGFVFNLDDMEHSLERALEKLEEMEPIQLAQQCRRYFDSHCSVEKMNMSLLELYATLYKESDNEY